VHLSPVASSLLAPRISNMCGNAPPLRRQPGPRRGWGSVAILSPRLPMSNAAGSCLLAAWGDPRCGTKACNKARVQSSMMINDQIHED
jgi:hypothetical protein